MNVFFFPAAQDVFKQNKSPKHKNKDLLISASYFEIYGSKVSEKFSRIFNMLHFKAWEYQVSELWTGILGTCENCNCTSCYVFKNVYPSRTPQKCMYSSCKTLIFYCSCLKAVLTPLRRSNLSENADDLGCKKTNISIAVVLILKAILFFLFV